MESDRVRIEQAIQKKKWPQSILEKWTQDATESSKLAKLRSVKIATPTYPENLPISHRRDELISVIKNNSVVIVSGQTGSGKTTQLPKFCLEAGCGKTGTIALTQPRRIAAIAAAKRIAQELHADFGEQVGIKIRFQEQTSANTQIKVMTDGILLAETQYNRDLLEYDAIIIDEAHERSLNIDFLIGYLRDLRRRRLNLKIIITSATIDTKVFSEAFNNAPVVEVSGRMYPVEVRYLPVEQFKKDSNDFTHVEAATKTADDLIAKTHNGDILIFMPSESDIRETCEKLRRRLHSRVTILPLFSRLSLKQQQQVFSSANNRRVIVSTNIAETSLTIPNIRYVIDTGLSRISRYNPRTLTKGLPIEPISQSSAEQRKGRCGRTANGICIRLYDEKDFLSRPEYTEPEIQRSNLADVILRMLSLNLGSIYDFPFVEPPKKQSVDGGFQLLHQLGAIDSKKSLTKKGRSMARLPIDPTISRMILQARNENVIDEILIIAAGLSIQDPRERPTEEREKADEVHSTFNHARSDFISYLNIWETYQKKAIKISQNQLRKFCRSHFLSYPRMREWKDIHSQLAQILNTSQKIKSKKYDDALYDSIHRSILSGLLSNAACNKEGNIFTATRNREIMIFPGSSLFKAKIDSTTLNTKSNKKAKSKWIVAVENIETSRLFARTVAEINPEWLSELGSHLCKIKYDQPYWNLRSGRVLVRQRHILYGLEVKNQRIDYGTIQPNEATQIFIREGLVPAHFNTKHPFLSHNKRLCEKIEVWQNRKNTSPHVEVDERAYAFYAERIQENISSIHDLNRILRKHDSDYLKMEETDILEENHVLFDKHSFPDKIDIGNQSLDLSYAYKPGDVQDGVTVKVPFSLTHTLDDNTLEWLVPGLMEEKISFLMRTLPKSLRKHLVPIPEKARYIAENLKPTHPTFIQSLQEFVSTKYQLDIGLKDWNYDVIPDHLRMRIQIRNKNEKLIEGRDLISIKKQLDSDQGQEELTEWTETAKQWQKKGVKAWDFDDPPEHVEITKLGGVPIYGYPGLEADEERQSVTLKLFNNRQLAIDNTREGISCLATVRFNSQMVWLKRELKTLRKNKLSFEFLGLPDQLPQQSYEHICHHLFFEAHPIPLRKNNFESLIDRAEGLIKGISNRFISCLEELSKVRQDIVSIKSNQELVETELNRLLPDDILRKFTFEELQDLPRYLKALKLRIERSQINPKKESDRAALITPFQDKLEALDHGDASPTQKGLIKELNWMLEECRISIFAQEIGTRSPISAKRIEKKIKQIENTP